MIRTYQADHGALAPHASPPRRPTSRRNRVMAMGVIALVAASAGLLQHFIDNPASSGPATRDSGAYFATR